MADKNVESGFPVDGGADEKLDHLAKQVAHEELKSNRVERPIPSLIIHVDMSGRQLVAGFSFGSV